MPTRHSQRRAWSTVRMEAESGGIVRRRLQKTESAEMQWVVSGSTNEDDEIGFDTPCSARSAALPFACLSLACSRGACLSCGDVRGVGGVRWPACGAERCDGVCIQRTPAMACAETKTESTTLPATCSM